MKEEEIGKFMQEKLADYQQMPPEGLWNSIQQDAKLQQFNRIRRFRRLATRVLLPSAVVLITALCTILSINHTSHPTEQNIVSPQKKCTTLPKISKSSSQNYASENQTTQSIIAYQNTPKNQNPTALLDVNSEKATEEKTTGISESHEIISPQITQPKAAIPEPTQVSLDKQIVKNDIQQLEEIPQQPNSPQKAVASHEETEYNHLKSGELRFSHDTLVCRNSQLTLFVENAAEVYWSTGTTEPTLVIYPDEPLMLYANIVRMDKVDTIIYIRVGIYDCELFVPTAFTPNGDGLNDIFLVHAPMDFTGYECVIFDRQGRTIFQSKSIYYGWDGTFDGKPMPQGAYFYAITYRDELNEKHVQKGQIVLVR